MSALPLRLPESEPRDRLLWIGTGPGASAENLAEICEIEEIPARAALAAILARQPDAVVARVEEGGLELLRDLRRQARDLPILLVGASEESCLDALEAGASDVLVEPFSPRALAARVAAALRRARARREALLRERDLLAEAQMAAEALDRSEERFQAFLRNSPVASWMTDEEGRVLFLSEPYTRMFGIRLEEASGRSLFDLFPLPFAQTFYDNIRAVAETNGTLETVEDAPLPDGTVGHFLV
ncbi:MAG TPA: PAS domain-containing protein, partial [Thermoanaerobaculia bacterium]|nr:PAS domain-containing protein [Thermoanaerobaculia bacterium]